MTYLRFTDKRSDGMREMNVRGLDGDSEGIGLQLTKARRVIAS